jgi:hypothetical protein
MAIVLLDCEDAPNGADVVGKINELCDDSNMADLAWTDIDEITNFSDASAVGYAQYTKRGKVVYLRGLVVASATSSGFPQFATLPVGYRPPATVRFVCTGYDDSGAVATVGRVSIQSTGECYIQHLNGSPSIENNDFFSLDGLFFFTE